MISLYTKRVAFAILLCGLLFSGGVFSAQAVINDGGGNVREDGGGDGGGVGGGGATTQCNDGVDNDGNGVTDYPSDLGCTSGLDATESGYTTATQCGDGIDNDANGFVDYPSDQGCTAANDTTESGYHTQCTDNIDNDGNGVKDYAADQGCSSKTDTIEAGYVVPPTPPPGVIVYKTVSKRDYYVKTHPDMLANGGVDETAAHGYPQYPTTQVSPTGTRICYLYDPTAFITEWNLGGFDSPGNNSMAAWNPSLGKWYRASANSFGNKRYNYLTCKTNAAPDTSLTATAGGITATTLSVPPSTPVTLTWLSRYGQIRQGTFTATNFSLTATIPGHWENVVDFSCDNGGDDWGNESVNIARDSSSRSLLAAAAGCYWNSSTQWIPESTSPRPYGGSNIVTPTTTTTYTYRGTNANGANSSSVTVNVVGDALLTECADLTDNDADGKIDFPQDLGCTDAADTTESPDPGIPQCTDGYDNDADGQTDSQDLGCQTNPDDPTTTEDDSPTLSCTAPTGVIVGGTGTYSANITPAGAYTYAWTATGGQTCTANCNSANPTYSFPTASSYQMSLVATGPSNLSCDFTAVTATAACVPSSVIITASPDRVRAGGVTTIHWEASEGCSCTVSGPGLSSNANTGDRAVQINKQATFTSSCSGTTKSVLVNIVPNFEEF